MTKLSVNINKIATLRNARGGDVPNLLQVAKDIQAFGGQGITIHPRPDQRHIRYQDAFDLMDVVHTEYNIEGNPIESFLDLVLQIKPTQVTLVPDTVDALTSNAGWDTVQNASFLKEVISTCKEAGIRTSVFMDTNKAFIEGAKAIGADRIELYTEDYASGYARGEEKAILPYIECAAFAQELELGVNAGHDLNMQNIAFFAREIPNLLEVSIGHALISEAIYFGLENVINQYLYKLKQQK